MGKASSLELIVVDSMSLDRTSNGNFCVAEYFIKEIAYSRDLILYR